MYLSVCSDVFGKGAEVVQRLSECSEEGLPLADVLAHLFYLPIKHLHEYGRLLLKLATCYEVVGTYWKHNNTSFLSISTKNMCLLKLFDLLFDFSSFIVIA